MSQSSPATPAPRIAPVGLDGWIVQFDDRLSEPGNRAALGFAAAARAAHLPGVTEVASTLASVFLRTDPLATDDATIRTALERLLALQDWTRADWPTGRRRFLIPTAWTGPQFDEAADLAGLSAPEARRMLSDTELRVLTLGFAPGQPYLGQLPTPWDLPRQTGLTAQMPAGAVVVALRQIVLYSAPAPTGWRHIGQTAVRLFDPAATPPALLRPGDVIRFPEVSARDLDLLQSSPDGGVTCEALS